MSFNEWMEHIVRAFEAAGVAILAVGSLWALVSSVGLARRAGLRKGYESARQTLGRSILLGLEVLIVADIVRTITIDTTLESTLSLGLVVLVRTFLSLSLEIELYGELPWKRSGRGEPE